MRSDRKRAWVHHEAAAQVLTLEDHPEEWGAIQSMLAELEEPPYQVDAVLDGLGRMDDLDAESLQKLRKEFGSTKRKRWRLGR